MPDKTIKLFLEIDGKQAHITLDASTLKTKELQASLDKVNTKNLSGGFSELTASVRQFAGAMGIAFGTAQLFEFVKSSLEVAAQEKRAIQELDAAIKSTKGAAGLTTEALVEMAEALEKTNRFKFDHKEIMEAQSLLLTFTKVTKDSFSTVMQLALDMSVRFKQDLKASIIQIGKAMQDPILGATALRRVGVQLSDQQTEQIKIFMASNDVLSAQKIIMGELTTQVSGAAAASQTDFDEKVKASDKSLEKLKITLGNALIPMMTKFSDSLSNTYTNMDKIIGAIAKLSDAKIPDWLSKFLSLGSNSFLFHLGEGETMTRDEFVKKYNASSGDNGPKLYSDEEQLKIWNDRKETAEFLNKASEKYSIGIPQTGLDVLLDNMVEKNRKLNNTYDYQNKTVGEIKKKIADLDVQLDSYVKGTKEYSSTIALRDKLQLYIKDDKHLVEQRAVLAAELLEKSQTGLDKELAALDKYYIEKMKIAKGDAVLELALHNYVENEKKLKIKDSEIEIRKLIREMEGYNKEFHNPIETDMFGRKHADFGTLEDANPEGETQKNWTPYDYAQKEYDRKPYAERLKDEQEVWNATHKTILAGVDSIDAGVTTMWSEFITGSRQAKDAWDAIWLSMRNTALDALRDVVEEWMKSGIKSIFNSPTDKAQASGSSSDGGSIFGDIIGALGSIFGLADGGIVNHPMIAKIGEVGPEMVMPLRNIKTYFGGNSNTKNIESIMDRKLNQFVEAVGNIDTLLTGENIHFAGDRAKQRIKSNNL